METLGVDLGLTSLGLCELRGGSHANTHVLSLPKNRKGLNSLSLFVNNHLMKDPKDILETCINSSDLVVIEKPFRVMGHGKKLFEVLGIIEYLCITQGVPYVLVAQMTLKAFAANGRKFSTDKKKTKGDLAKFATEDYSYEFNTTDETDAFWLAMIGYCIAEPDNFPKTYKMGKYSKRVELTRKLEIIDESNKIVLVKDYNWDNE